MITHPKGPDDNSNAARIGILSEYERCFQVDDGAFGRASAPYAHPPSTFASRTGVVIRYNLITPYAAWPRQYPDCSPDGREYAAKRTEMHARAHFFSLIA